MPLHLSIVADVFPHRAQAKHAVEALRRAGFDYDQIGIAMQGHEGIDLRSDLERLGVPHEQANYYAQEVKAGHTVVSVRPDGREQEAHEIMQRSGAFTDADDAPSHTSNISTQSTVGDHALASQTQEDFHRPRSLKPRADRPPVVSTQPVQTEKAALVTEQKSSSAPVVQQNEVISQKPDVAPDVQNNQVSEQRTETEEEHRETIDNEKMPRLLRNPAQSNTDMLPPQTQLEKPKNRALVKNGMYVGGALLGVVIGTVFALLQREQIRQFVVSTAQTMKAQIIFIIKRNHDD